MNKIPIKEAAERCGLKLETLQKLLALPEDDPRRPKSLTLVDDEHLDAASVLRYVKRSEERQHYKHMLDDEELALVIHQAGKMRHGVRNQALIALSNYSGPRAVEMSRLMLRDVIDSNRQLLQQTTLKRSRTKNKKPRTIYFRNSIVRKYLQAHIDQRFKDGAFENDPLFVGALTKQQMTRHNMARAITYIYERCGHPECSSHSGRVRVGTKYIKQKDLKAAQLMLGHACASTTMLYGQYTDDEIGAIQEDI